MASCDHDGDSRDSGVADLDVEDNNLQVIEFPQSVEKNKTSNHSILLDVPTPITSKTSYYRQPLQDLGNHGRFEMVVRMSPKVPLSSETTPFRKSTSDGSILGRGRPRSTGDSDEPPAKRSLRFEVLETELHFGRVKSTSSIERCSQELPPEHKTIYHLPTLNPEDTHAFKRISAVTLLKLFGRLTQAEFLEKYIIIDCRYPYEYDGGHVKHAVNLFDPEACADLFFPNGVTDRRVPIFYCEYSSVRGPTMANRLREMDRRRNYLDYPRLDYKEIYVLDQGYKNFFTISTNLDSEAECMCSPNSYISMNHPDYAEELLKFQFHRGRRTRKLAECRRRLRRHGQESTAIVRRGELFSPEASKSSNSVASEPSYSS